METELGVGNGMGNTCKPMAVSFQCMTKFTTSKKKKKEKKKTEIDSQTRDIVVITEESKGLVMLAMKLKT